METAKQEVKDFWEESSCGEDLYLKGYSLEDYHRQSKMRYSLEPQIVPFGQFYLFKGKKTLEIGVGLGADHQLLAEAGALLTGVDLTERALGHTRGRFELSNLDTHLLWADAENLPFGDATFDAVYSWGVLHHTPDMPKAFREVRRVLKPGGLAKIMVYHKYSLVGFMLWIRYALLRLRPFTPLSEIYSRHLESPGTKAYSKSEAEKLLEGFETTAMETPLTHGDLLASDAGQRHRGRLLSLAKRLWPRFLLRKLFPQYGLYLMITCFKKSE